MSKKIFAFLFGAAALLAAGCTDLSEINADIDSIKSEVDALAARAKANEEAVAALNKAVDAGYVISSCQPFEGNPGGYTITFSNGQTITLYHGVDGANGANGNDGAAFFQNVEVTEEAMVFTLSDGKEITIPLEAAFELVLGEPELVVDEEFVAYVYNYTVKAATEKTTVGGLAGGSYTVEVYPEDETSGSISIICPNDAEKNTVVVYADNGAGKTSIKAIAVPGEILEITATDYVLDAKGEEADIWVTSNIYYSIEIEAENNWLSLKPDTKAIETHKHTLVAVQNASPVARTATVSILDISGTAVQTYTITQMGVNLDELSFEELHQYAKPIFGNGNGVEGIWDILYNEDYSIRIDRPTFSMSCEAENLIDGDLTSTNGVWFAKFDSKNDDPIVFIYDMKANIVPTAFYVQHFSDTPLYKKFKFYVAAEYNGEETAWVEVAHADGSQSYMEEAEYDFQNEEVCNAAGPTGKIAYTLTYKTPISAKAEGRYFKFEIYPDFEADANGKGKMNEVYLTGIYVNPAEDPANYPYKLTSVYGGDNGTMEWEVLAGEDYCLGWGPDATSPVVGTDKGYSSVYKVANLFNGIIGTPAWGTKIDWRGWHSTTLETPFEIVVDMKHVYTPKVFHVADEADGTGGNWTDFGFYLADSYNPENPDATEWKLSVSKKLPAPGYGANNVYDYVSKEPVSGRYLKVKFNSSNGYKTFGLLNYCSLAEIWFDTYENVLPSDRPFKVFGNGEWKIIEGADYSASTGGDRAAAEAHFNAGNAYGEDGTGTDQYGQTLAEAVDAEAAVYCTAHLFDGNLSTVWNTWAYTLNVYPIVFVVDLGATHTPVAYHKVETAWCSGSNVDWTISLADTYKGEATEWKVSFDGQFGPNNWTGGKDEKVEVTNKVSGRYMKISMNTWGGAIYEGGDGPYQPYRLAEIYFEEYK